MRETIPNGEAAFWLIDTPEDRREIEFNDDHAFLVLAHGSRPRLIPSRMFSADQYPIIVVMVQKEHARVFLKMPQWMVDQTVLQVRSLMMGEVLGHA